MLGYFSSAVHNSDQIQLPSSSCLKNDFIKLRQRLAVRLKTSNLEAWYDAAEVFSEDMRVIDIEGGRKYYSKCKVNTSSFFIFAIDLVDTD